jgi:hypothetical protein
LAVVGEQSVHLIRQHLFAALLNLGAAALGGRRFDFPITDEMKCRLTGKINTLVVLVIEYPPIMFFALD